MTEEERALLEQMTADLVKEVDEDDKVEKLKANEQSKYLAASYDRFSTGAFIAALIASGFTITTSGSLWPRHILVIYGSLCILWFSVAIFLHYQGRVVLAKGLR
jgi:hypothetical protein